MLNRTNFKNKTLFAYLFIGFTFLSVASIISCNTPTKPSEKYTKPPKPVLDSITTWLGNTENINSAKYASLFNQQLQTQITNQNFDSMFHIMAVSLVAFNNTYSYDSVIIPAIVDYATKYENKLTDKSKYGFYQKLGKCYLNLSQNDKSIAISRKGIAAIYDYNSASNVGCCYANLCENYYDKRQNDSAIYYGLKAIKIFEEQDMELLLGRSFNDLAKIFNSLNDQENQNLYLNKALALAKKNNIKNGILASYTNKITFKIPFEDFQGIQPDADSLLYYIHIFKDAPTMFSVMAYSGKSVSYSQSNQITSAKLYLDSVNQLIKKEPQFAAIDFYKLALLLYSKATNTVGDNKSLFDQMLIEGKKNSDFNTVVNVSSVYYKTALLNKDYKRAIEYKMLQSTYVDSISKNAIHKEVVDVEKKYQTEKKEKQIQIQKSELEKKKFQILGLLASFIALALGTVAFLIYRKRKQSKKDYENQVQFTASLFEKTEEERKRIATDLHDSVSHDLLNLKTENQAEFATINTKIDSIIDEIRSISRNLHPVLFESLGLQISLENMFDRLQSQHQIIISHEINYAKNLNTNDELQVYRIIQEGLSNIIKYADAHAAKISINSTSSQINIEIKDSGKGFNVAEKLASGKAFGLHNIMQRAKTLGGEAIIESNQNGTTVSIKIPIK